MISLFALFALTLPGLWLLVVGLLRLIRTNPEMQWARTEGRVEFFDVETDVDRRLDLGTLPLGGKEARRVTAVQYTYAYNGIQYQGDRIAPLQFGPNIIGTPKSLLRRFPPGKPVTVYVNPANPGKSVLEPMRQPAHALALCLIGLAVIGIGVYIASTN